MKKRIVLLISIIVSSALLIVAGVQIRNSVRPVTLVTRSLGAHYDGTTVSDGVYRMNLTIPVRNHTGRTLYYKVTADFREEYEAGLIGERYLTDEYSAFGMHAIGPHETDVMRCYFETKALKADSTNPYWRQKLPKLQVTVVEESDMDDYTLPPFTIPEFSADTAWTSPNKIDALTSQKNESKAGLP